MKILLLPLLIWFVAHGIKVFNRCFKERRVSWQNFNDDGGMPSSHSVFVSSLTTAVLLAQGWQSPIFAVTLAFAAIVVHDAMTLRYTVEQQSKALNQLRSQLKNLAKLDYQPLTERAGHTFLEVAAGVLIGTGAAILLNALF